jgi:hypothetical protein
MRENCRRSKLESWPEKDGDGMLYEVDLGNPLISLSNQEILEEHSLTDKKDLLGRVVDYELTNILLRKAKVRAFTEIKRNEVNSSGFMTGARFEGRDSDNPDDIYTSIREAIIVQLFVLKAHNRKEEQEPIKQLLRSVPYAWYYKDLLKSEHAPELFDWIDTARIPN